MAPRTCADHDSIRTWPRPQDQFRVYAGLEDGRVAAAWDAMGWTSAAARSSLSSGFQVPATSTVITALQVIRSARRRSSSATHGPVRSRLWFGVRVTEDLRQTGWNMTRIRDFEPTDEARGARDHHASSARNKARSLAVDDRGPRRPVYHNDTASHSSAGVPDTQGEICGPLTFARPRATVLLARSRTRAPVRAILWNVDLYPAPRGHRLQALFGKIWYEGAVEPVHPKWQSTGGDQRRSSRSCRSRPWSSAR